MLRIDPEDFERLSHAQQLRVVQLAQAERTMLEREIYEGSLAEFTRAAWKEIESVPLVWNWHLDTICAYLEAFFLGKIQNLILNVPPGSMKSILLSVMGPAWLWTLDPGQRLISITNEITLATRDNRRMKQVITSDWYQKYWGDKVILSTDQQEKTLYENTAMGFRQGLGIRGNVTGKRGNKLLLDDLVDAKKAFSDVMIADATQTLDQAIMNRLNHPTKDGIALIMQRLRTNDPTGHLLTKKATNWVHVKIAQLYEGTPGFDPVRDLGPDGWRFADPRTKVGELMFPKMFPQLVINKFKEDLGDYGFAGQHQQRPSPLSGGIIKRRHWQVWPKTRPFPKILHTFASWDTAFSTEDFKSNAFSARTDWGVWQDEFDVPLHAKDNPEHPEHHGRYKVLMLAAWWKRVDFDELLGMAVKVQKRRLHRPSDAHLIEEKASGISLLQVLRRRPSIRVLSFDPKTNGGGDKIARAYSVQSLFSAKCVWVPNRAWAVGREPTTAGEAREPGVIDIISEFPTGASPCADLTDTVTQALRYLENGWWIHHPDDDIDPIADDMRIGKGKDPFDNDDLDDSDADVVRTRVTRRGGIYG